MKKKVYVIVLMCLLGSCTNSNQNNKIDPYNILLTGNESWTNPRVYTYDSCEYVIAGGENGLVLTHKGNCKYCIEREKEKQNRK